MTRQVEFLIVGQGLAGSALAWELLRRGRDVAVVDPGDEVTSSRMAAGLVTPITGRRLALSWRVSTMLPAARAYYDWVAAELGRPVFNERVVLRIFRDGEEAARWGTRRSDPAFATFAGREFAPGSLGDAPFGAVEFRGGGDLDCAGYLAASREAFRARGRFECRRLDPREAAEFPARRVIFCEGYAAARNPFFPWINWKAAKGELLTVRVPALAGERRILTAGQWLAPVGGGQFRTGSTYEWDRLDTEPTAAAREALEKGLRRLTPHPFEVIAHSAAVRPIINESRALVGLHPANEKLGFFNGLGSKGALHAPVFAADFAAHLTGEGQLDPECDLQANT